MVAGVLAHAAVGCSSSSGSSAAEPNQQGSTSDNWQTLITGDWTVPPGTETYTCVRQTVTEDFYVKAFEAINPLGTHHTLLTMGDPDAPDGITPCNAGTNHPLSVFGSGVGTNPFEFPEGIALKVPKGSQLLLNLHLFNTGTDPAGISGTSGTRIQTVPASAVVNVAEGILAGTINITLPPHMPSTASGNCTMSSNVTLISVAPHMHQLGVYMKVDAMSSIAGNTTIFDGPYSFDDQSYHALTPLQLAMGDKVHVACSYNNTTDNTVTFGQSSLAEMCFAGLYRYPADGSSYGCVDAQ